MHLYSIYDKKSQSYQPPFPAPTPGIAERILRDALRNTQNTIAQYPEDFDLVEVGTWNEQQPELSTFYTKPMHLANALAVKESN